MNDEGLPALVKRTHDLADKIMLSLIGSETREAAIAAAEVLGHVLAMLSLKEGNNEQQMLENIEKIVMRNYESYKDFYLSHPHLNPLSRTQ